MTYCDCNTRKLCESIVEKAKNEVGFTVDDSKLLVEAKQGLNGTVTLFLSKIPVSDESFEELFGQTLKFENIDEILDSDVIFNRYGDIVKTREIYLYENKYYIYFEILSSRKKAKNILLNLLEFADRSGVSREVLEEHGVKMYTYI